MIVTDFPGTSLSLKLLVVCGDALIKGAVIMFAVGLITTAMRKTSPATRHLVWAIALCGALVLPILSAAVPTLRLSLPPRITAVAHPTLAALDLRSPSLHAAAAAPEIAPVVAAHGDPAAVAPTAKTGSLAARTWHRMAHHWPLLLLSIWGLGAVAVGLAGLIGHWSVARRLARAQSISTGPIALLAGEICREIKLRRPTRFALDANLRIPLAHGIFRPCVLLPIAAESWPREKLRTVLLHELAHVARWDCATLFGGLIACTLHWPDPLAWWGWRRLRSECERACDDVVLRCATPPADYAENLLTIARSLHSPSRSLPLPATLAMARPSELKGRIAAILDDRRNRRPISVRLAVGMLIGGALAVASFAALHLQASPPLPRSHFNNKPTAAPEITAKVLNPDGSPAAGANAILIPAGQNATIYLTTSNQAQGDITTRTQADGRVNFEPQRGNYQIVLYDDSGSAVLSRSQMPKTGVIHLTKWGHIQGLLLFGTKPGANKKILAYSDVPLDSKPGNSYSGVSWWVTARTDSSGRFRISRFPAGKASVQMRISGPMAGESGALGCPVTVLPGKTVKVTLGGVGQTVEGRITVPQSLAAIHGWYFEMADAETKPLPWPMPASIKHGSDAQKSRWLKKVFATAAGKAFFARYQLWRRTQLHDYFFVINAVNAFTIHDVVPGTYIVTAYAVNPAVTVRQKFGSADQVIGTVDATFTVPPIPGGVTDVPLKIPPFKLVPLKVAKP